MRIVRKAMLPLLLAAVTTRVFTQTPAPPTPAGPTFDVVSIKRNVTGVPTIGPPIDRPDGGFSMKATSVMALINRAFPQKGPAERTGLPGWATTERYDVSTTSLLSRPTPEDRAAMVRAMLADRFKLAAHVEKHELPVYDLVLARSDGKLGPGLTSSDVDCARIAEERAAARARDAGTPPPPASAPDLKTPPPLCTIRLLGAVVRDRPGERGGDGLGRLGDLLEGETTMDGLAEGLRAAGVGRFVVNKTGRPGSYRIRMNFDWRGAGRGPDAAASTPDAAPSVFTALQEQLGLKLESSRAEGERLVIDRLERPTED